MRRLLNYIDKNLLLKIASLNSVAILTRVLVGFLTSKAIAYFIGPSGMAMVGNLRDFMGSARSFASLGFYSGIVKYTSEFKEDTLRLAKKISTVLYTVMSISVLLAILIFFSAEWINTIIFDKLGNFAFVIKLLAIALPFYSLNLILMAVLNGTSRFKFLLGVSIIGHIITGLITLYLIWQHALNGALIAVVVSEISILIIILIGLRKRQINWDMVSFKNYDFASLKNLGAYSAMSLFTAATLPLTFVFIRNYLSEEVSLADAGYWEAMNRISKYYLMFISSLLTLYVLPRLSAINTSREFRVEIFKFYKQIVPIFIGGLLIIYFLRDYLILLIFTEEFLKMENLFFWQMLGDILKVLSLVISYQFLAKRMLWPYLITEALSIAILIVSSIYLIDIYGTVGATIAHFVTYAVYLIVLIFVFRKELFGRDSVI